MEILGLCGVRDIYDPAFLTKDLEYRAQLRPHEHMTFFQVLIFGLALTRTGEAVVQEKDAPEPETNYWGVELPALGSRRASS